MAAKAYATSPEHEEIHVVESTPPPPGEEGYAKPTEVRELPASLMDLLKKRDNDAELADIADLADLVSSSRAPQPAVVASGIVAKRDEEPDPVVVPPPPRLPRHAMVPPPRRRGAVVFHALTAHSRGRERAGQVVLVALSRTRHAVDELSHSGLIALVVLALSLLYATVTWMLGLW
jgi:hypothetical protein